MAKVSLCDHCHKQLDPEKNPLIVKMFMAPVVPGRRRSDHSNYSAHMDIGKCCQVWLLELGWIKRRARKEYLNGRKHSAGSALASSSSRKASESK